MGHETVEVGRTARIEARIDAVTANGDKDMLRIPMCNVDRLIDDIINPPASDLVYGENPCPHLPGILELC